jgi:death-on-curing protein
MAGLTIDDLIEVARRTVGRNVEIRDAGLLCAALARIEARFQGRDVYPTIEEKAAALLHSLATTAPLVQGNRVFAWIATVVFLARHGRPAMVSDEEATALVTAVVTGRLESVREIAARLAPAAGSAAV